MNRLRLALSPAIRAEPATPRTICPHLEPAPARDVARTSERLHTPSPGKTEVFCGAVRRDDAASCTAIPARPKDLRLRGLSTPAPARQRRNLATIHSDCRLSVSSSLQAPTTVMPHNVSRIARHEIPTVLVALGSELNRTTRRLRWAQPSLTPLLRVKYDRSSDLLHSNARKLPADSLAAPDWCLDFGDRCTQRSALHKADRMALIPYAGTWKRCCMIRSLA